MRTKKITLSTFLLLTLCALSHAQTPPYAWAAQATGGSEITQINLAIDKQHHVLYSAGSFEDRQIDFGTGELDNVDPFNNSDIFIAKYTTDGTILSAITFGGNGSDIVTGVATDGSGNVFIGGYYDSDTLRFGSYVLTNSNASSDNAFLVKLDANGNVLWAKNCAVAANSSIMPDGRSNVAVDNSGNVYFAACLTGASANFDGHTITYNLAPNGGAMFVIKFDGNGTYQWSTVSQSLHTSLDPGVALPAAITIDKDGNCVAAGKYSGDNSFGATLINTSNDNYFDRFVTKINGTTGAFIWAGRSGVWQGPETNDGVSTDGSGNIYLTGDYVYPTEGELSNAYSADFFIQKLTFNGDSSWLYHSPMGSIRYAITSDNAGNSYVGVTVEDSVATFGGITVNMPVPNNFGVPNINAIVVKYDNNGTAQWAKVNAAHGFVPAAMIGGIVTDDNGYVYVNGSVSDTCVFDSHVLIGDNANNDAFIARIGGAVSSIGSPLITDNSVSVFPNPSAEQFHFRFSTVYTKVEMSLYDLQGQLVAKTNTGAATSYSWNIANRLSPGSYMCRITGYRSNAMPEVMTKMLVVK